MNFRLIALAAGILLIARKAMAKYNATYDIEVNPDGLPSNIKISGLNLTLNQKFIIQNNNLREDFKFDSIIGNVVYGNRTVGQFTSSGTTIKRNSSVTINANITLQLLPLLTSGFSNVKTNEKIITKYVIRVGAVQIPGETFFVVNNFKSYFDMIKNIFSGRKSTTNVAPTPPRPDVIVVDSGNPVFVPDMTNIPGLSQLEVLSTL
jgi:hypothetical protein